MGRSVIRSHRARDGMSVVGARAGVWRSLGLSAAGLVDRYLRSPCCLTAVQRRRPADARADARRGRPSDPGARLVRDRGGGEPRCSSTIVDGTNAVLSLPRTSPVDLALRPAAGSDGVHVRSGRPPVPARRSRESGLYRAGVDFDCPGEWAADDGDPAARTWAKRTARVQLHVLRGLPSTPAIGEPMPVHREPRPRPRRRASRRSRPTTTRTPTSTDLRSRRHCDGRRAVRARLRDARVLPDARLWPDARSREGRPRLTTRTDSHSSTSSRT